MSSLLKKLNEASDLGLYKRILASFSCFVDSQPGTGINRIYKQLLDRNLKIMPKDKRALEILDYVTKDKSDSAAVQDLMNKTFSDLPCTCRPSYKVGSSKMIAFWNCGGKLYTKVFDLLSLQDSTGSKFWSDEAGNKIELIDLSVQEN